MTMYSPGRVHSVRATYENTINKNKEVLGDAVPKYFLTALVSSSKKPEVKPTDQNGVLKTRHAGDDKGDLSKTTFQKSATKIQTKGEDGDRQVRSGSQLKKGLRTNGVISGNVCSFPPSKPLRRDSPDGSSGFLNQKDTNNARRPNRAPSVEVLSRIEEPDNEESCSVSPGKATLLAASLRRLPGTKSKSPTAHETSNLKKVPKYSTPFSSNMIKKTSIGSNHFNSFDETSNHTTTTQSLTSHTDRRMATCSSPSTIGSRSEGIVSRTEGGHFWRDKMRTRTTPTRRRPKFVPGSPAAQDLSEKGSVVADTCDPSSHNEEVHSSPSLAAKSGGWKRRVINTPSSSSTVVAGNCRSSCYDTDTDDDDNEPSVKSAKPFNLRRSKRVSPTAVTCARSPAARVRKSVKDSSILERMAVFESSWSSFDPSSSSFCEFDENGKIMKARSISNETLLPLKPEADLDEARPGPDREAQISRSTQFSVVSSDDDCSKINHSGQASMASTDNGGPKQLRSSSQISAMASVDDGVWPNRPIAVSNLSSSGHGCSNITSPQIPSHASTASSNEEAKGAADRSSDIQAVQDCSEGDQPSSTYSGFLPAIPDLFQSSRPLRTYKQHKERFYNRRKVLDATVQIPSNSSIASSNEEVEGAADRSSDIPAVQDCTEEDQSSSSYSGFLPTIPDLFQSGRPLRTFKQHKERFYGSRKVLDATIQIQTLSRGWIQRMKYKLDQLQRNASLARRNHSSFLMGIRTEKEAIMARYKRKLSQKRKDDLTVDKVTEIIKELRNQNGMISSTNGKMATFARRMRKANADIQKRTQMKLDECETLRVEIDEKTREQTGLKTIRNTLKHDLHGHMVDLKLTDKRIRHETKWKSKMEKNIASIMAMVEKRSDDQDLITELREIIKRSTEGKAEDSTNEFQINQMAMREKEQKEQDKLAHGLVMSAALIHEEQPCVPTMEELQKEIDQVDEGFELTFCVPENDEISVFTEITFEAISSGKDEAGSERLEPIVDEAEFTGRSQEDHIVKVNRGQSVDSNNIVEHAEFTGRSQEDHIVEVNRGQNVDNHNIVEHVVIEEETVVDSTLVEETVLDSTLVEETVLDSSTVLLEAEKTVEASTEVKGVVVGETFVEETVEEGSPKEDETIMEEVVIDEKTIVDETIVQETVVQQAVVHDQGGELVVYEVYEEETVLDEGTFAQSCASSTYIERSVSF